MPRAVAAGALAATALLLLLLAVYAWFSPAPSHALAGAPGWFEILSVLGLLAVMAVALGVPHLVGSDWPWHHRKTVGVLLSVAYGTAIVWFAHRRWPSPGAPSQ